jgi:hypothetical protein
MKLGARNNALCVLPVLLCSMGLCSLPAGMTAPASAQDAGALLTMLTNAESFQVRARAALALSHSDDVRAPAALEAALLDSHAAVRAAAANALGQVATHRAVPGLRKATSDGAPIVANAAKAALRAIAAREAIDHAVTGVRQGASTASDETLGRGARQHASLQQMRYAVVVGEVRDRSGTHAPSLTPYLAERIAISLRELPHIAVFSLSEMTEEVADQLARRKLPLFRVEANLTQLQQTRVLGDYKTRCEVSLLLMDEPDRTLRSALKGAASSSEQPRGEPVLQADRIAHKTLANAVQSALANAVQAIESAASQRSSGGTDAAAEATLGERGHKHARH